MPGTLVQTSATGVCSHGGQMTVAGTGARVLLLGQPAAKASDIHPIVGCPLNISGKPQPCITARNSLRLPGLYRRTAGAPQYECRNRQECRAGAPRSCRHHRSADSRLWNVAYGPPSASPARRSHVCRFSVSDRLERPEPPPRMPPGTSATCSSRSFLPRRANASIARASAAASITRSSGPNNELLAETVRVTAEAALQQWLGHLIELVSLNLERKTTGSSSKSSSRCAIKPSRKP